MVGVKRTHNATVRPREDMKRSDIAVKKIQFKRSLESLQWSGKKKMNTVPHTKWNKMENKHHMPYHIGDWQAHHKQIYLFSPQTNVKASHISVLLLPTFAICWGWKSLVWCYKSIYKDQTLFLYTYSNKSPFPFLNRHTIMASFCRSCKTRNPSFGLGKHGSCSNYPLLLSINPSAIYNTHSVRGYF